MNKRKSWDTSIKHLARLGLLDSVLTKEQIALIPISCRYRWEKESADKYSFCEINEILTHKTDIIKAICESPGLLELNESYLKLANAFCHITSEIKGLKKVINKNKEIIVNTIEEVRNIIPIGHALTVFNISRSTYENYKSIVIHQCDASYFKWCTKRFHNQLLPKEVLTIKNYMKDVRYKDWSKISVYAKAVRDHALLCCPSTFYKYCRLLGFPNKARKRKSDHYHPLKTSYPNEKWCADVTIFKTPDGTKHYIHLLVDHFSKRILDFRIENFNNAKAIVNMLHNARHVYKPEKIDLLTDGGVENINSKVSDFFTNLNIPGQHQIAQRDVLFSNSLIESINKVIKHQFLYPKEIQSRTELERVLASSVNIYNSIRPQWSLQGNTPIEIYEERGKPFRIYKEKFKYQMKKRLTVNRLSNCKNCS